MAYEPLICKECKKDVMSLIDNKCRDCYHDEDEGELEEYRKCLSELQFKIQTKTVWRLSLDEKAMILTLVNKAVERLE